jgi:transcriptional regulator with XRE-family HTH domain
MSYLEFLRRSQGLTQQALAAKTRIPRGTISQIETGRLVPTDGQLRRVAVALKWDGAPCGLMDEARP